VDYNPPFLPLNPNLPRKRSPLSKKKTKTERATAGCLGGSGFPGGSGALQYTKYSRKP
jgi:hypothetical protein